MISNDASAHGIEDPRRERRGGLAAGSDSVHNVACNGKLRLACASVPGALWQALWLSRWRAP